MATLRFPNSQSDVDRLVEQMRLVAKAFPAIGADFSLDDMRDVLAGEYQISSSGTSGSLAIKRSTRPDRSRDPLYNQVKMMSELYRMFGWIRSIQGNRLRFRMTNLGLQLALDAPNYGRDFESGLIRESILRIVFPNETTTNVGVQNQRPFSWLLRLASRCDGKLSRDEIIFGVLAVTDDRVHNLLQQTAQEILRLRASKSTAVRVESLAKQNQVQVNTLQNYTRIPIGVLTSTRLDWAKKIAVRETGSRTPVTYFELTATGVALAERLDQSLDLRLSDLTALTLEERATLADYAFFDLLRVAGIPANLIEQDLAQLKPKFEEIMSELGLRGLNLLFNPECQETDRVLALLDTQ